MKLGGQRQTREAIVAQHDRERQVVQLFMRGLAWAEIGRQLNMSGWGVKKAFDRAVKRIPPKDVELLRKLQSERLDDARRRIYSELAGREMQDPANPGQKTTLKPEIGQVDMLVARIAALDRQEAELYGLNAPKKTDILQTFAVGAPSLTDEEIEIRMGRLTEDEQQLYLQLIAKMDGRWVEPHAIEDQGTTVETTATTVEGGPNDGAP